MEGQFFSLVSASNCYEKKRSDDSECYNDIAVMEIASDIAIAMSIL